MALTTFYPKGKDVTMTYPDGTTKNVVNDLGSHMIRVHGKGLQYVNRIDSRKVQRSHPATKKNYKHQVEVNGFKHDVNPHNVPEKRRHPDISNHTAHRERQLMRLNRKG